MKNLTGKIFCLIAMAMLVCISSGANAEVAGHVQFVNGMVQLTTVTGQMRAIQKGDAVSEGDTLSSAPAASAQIKMSDGGIVALRQDTRLRIDSFKFNGQQDGSERSFFSLIKGGFRAITGLVGRVNAGNYRISTPTATIGIRGTDHETFVVVPGSAMAALAPAGTYNKVNRGETTMSTGRGLISILPNQMGYAGAADQPPQLQPINLDIFTSVPAPLPQAQGGKQEPVRESAVVDNVLQPPNIGPGYTVPTNTVVMMRPITATFVTTGITFTGAPNRVVTVLAF